jgi:hypothetical protein
MTGWFGASGVCSKVVPLVLSSAPMDRIDRMEIQVERKIELHRYPAAMVVIERV